MSSWGLMLRGVGFGALLSCAVACSAATDDPQSPEPTDGTEQAVSPGACTVLCIQGYHANQQCACVPDKPVKGDCTPACGKGKYCTVCKTTTGSGYVCLPRGATC